MAKKMGRTSLAQAVSAVLLTFASSLPVAGQSAPPIQGTTTTIPDLKPAGVLSNLVTAVAPQQSADALVLATKLAVATTPLPSLSGGFEIKLDPSTGLQVRTATTFGPSFAERALTSGEGKVIAGVSFMSSSLERLGSQSYSGLQLFSLNAAAPANSRSATANIKESANTIVIGGRVGVTSKLDIGVSVPIVSLKVDGSTSLTDGTGSTLTFASGSKVGAGVGDVAGIVKYRFYSFGKDQLPDPGGLALMATIRLPTGDTASMRGLGVTRTLVSFIGSSGQGRFRPHANVGFEWWNKGVSVSSDAVQGGTVTARHQLQYAAGLELEAAPKFTALLDVVGGEVFGGGKLGFQADPATPSSSSLAALSQGLTKLMIVPGLKLNLKSKLVLSANALVTLKDDGLHARVTPMAGLDLTF
jgi:hypothetical protein